MQGAGFVNFFQGQVAVDVPNGALAVTPAFGEVDFFPQNIAAGKIAIGGASEWILFAFHVGQVVGTVHKLLDEYLGADEFDPYHHGRHDHHQ